MTMSFGEQAGHPAHPACVNLLQQLKSQPHEFCCCKTSPYRQLCSTLIKAQYQLIDSNADINIQRTALMTRKLTQI